MKHKIESYFYDRCSEDEAKDVERWLVRNANSPYADALLRGVMADLKVEEDDERVRRAFNLFNSHRQQMAAASTNKKTIKNIWKWSQRIAAAMLIPLLISTFYLYRGSNRLQQWVEVYAPLGKSKVVVLPDSTKVWLKAGSTLIYPGDFSGNIRQVYLSGEAYAEVEKDRKRPFVMSAGSIRVEVLGTKFNLRSYTDDANAEVSLVEGSVKLVAEIEGKSHDVMLTPGDIIRFNKTSGKLKRYGFDAASYSHWFEGDNFYFIDETFEQIVHALEKRFNVKIVVEDKQILQERYYAVFINKESLDDILSALSAGRDMKIARRGSNVFISN